MIQHPSDYVPPDDYSDRIAWVQVCVTVLTDFDPASEWRDNRLLKKWNKSHYSLTRKEFATMERFLDGERKRVTSPPPIEYEQPDLFGGKRLSV